jgi:hypothetical protein
LVMRRCLMRNLDGACAKRKDFVGQGACLAGMAFLARAGGVFSTPN